MMFFLGTITLFSIQLRLVLVIGMAIYILLG